MAESIKNDPNATPALRKLVHEQLHNNYTPGERAIFYQGMKQLRIDARDLFPDELPDAGEQILTNVHRW